MRGCSGCHFGSLFTFVVHVGCRIRVPYPFQWGAPTFDAGEAFAMMAVSFVALVEVWLLLLYFRTKAECIIGYWDVFFKLHLLVIFYDHFPFLFYLLFHAVCPGAEFCSIMWWNLFKCHLGLWRRHTVVLSLSHMHGNRLLFWSHLEPC